MALVLYICAALSGVYVLSASARITPHPDEDGTVLIEIVKGDTLWDLCQEHLKDPLRWRELSKYKRLHQSTPHLSRRKITYSRRYGKRCRPNC